ncbi:hypothetical protein ACWGJ9_10570 [Curtobacterium citreum]
MRDPLDYPWAFDALTAGYVIETGFTAGQPTTADRTGRSYVVAVGSNASPDVMRDKFARYGAPVPFPMEGCTLTGVQVGHGAFVSAGGYIPAAPYASPGTIAHLWGAWLTERQVAALDTTEPNYDRMTLPAADWALTLDRGEAPARFGLYRSRHGMLRTGSGGPAPLAEQRTLLASITALGAPIPDDGQLAVSADLRSWLRSHRISDGLTTAVSVRA